MMLGVVLFSWSTGAITSILGSTDTKTSMLKEKISTLNEMSTEYDLSVSFFNELAKAIKYDHSKKYTIN